MKTKRQNGKEHHTAHGKSRPKHHRAITRSAEMEKQQIKKKARQQQRVHILAWVRMVASVAGLFQAGTPQTNAQSATIS